MSTDAFDLVEDTGYKYAFEKWGSYGRFQTAKSFPIDFIMSSFTTHQIDYLSFASDVQPSKEEINFSLLMQRDVDTQRVRRNLEPYLNPKAKEKVDTAIHSKARATFFPPLLVAVIPVQDRKMLPHYSAEHREEETRGSASLLVRTWNGMFKLTHRIIGTGDRGLKLAPVDAESSQIEISTEQVVANFEIHPSAAHGIKLVVIDGQHRLKAIKELLDRASSSSSLEGLNIPVCILFPPHSTEVMAQREANFVVPSVTDVFRDLFVDVNTTMETVSGHFRILLSSDDIGSLACRSFCQNLLSEEDGIVKLAAVEWNTKSDKDSEQIKKAHSITSINPLYWALQDNLSAQNKHSLLRSILGLDSVMDLLYPENESDDAEVEYPEVKWAQFSYSQKAVLEEQTSDLLYPVLKKILFDAKAFRTKYEIFYDAIKELETESEQSDSHESEIVQDVLNHILFYSDLSADGRKKLRRFEARVEESVNAQCSPILQYSIFQRGLFMAAFEIISVLNKYASASPPEGTDCFIVLMDHALEDRADVFLHTHQYMQHAVFNADRIKPKKKTREPIANLILAHLSNEEVRSNVMAQITDGLNISAGDASRLEQALKDKGTTASSQFLSYYFEEMKKDFSRRYRVDPSLDEETIDELSQLEERQNLLKRKLDNAEISGRDYKPFFDQKIHELCKTSAKTARADLKSKVGISADLVIEGYDADDDEEEG